MARDKDYNRILSEAHDNLAIQLDEPDANTTYVGLAKLGSLTSSSVWQIKKIVISGTVTSITYAGGDDSFNQVWDNRASLSYS